MASDVASDPDSFFAILIQGFGFNTDQTLILGMVQAFNAFAYFIFLWLGDRYKMRCLMSVAPSTLSTFGVLLVWLLPDSAPAGRLVGFILWVDLAARSDID